MECLDWSGLGRVGDPSVLSALEKKMGFDLGRNCFPKECYSWNARGESARSSLWIRITALSFYNRVFLYASVLPTMIATDSTSETVSQPLLNAFLMRFAVVMASLHSPRTLTHHSNSISEPAPRAFRLRSGHHKWVATPFARISLTVRLGEVSYRLWTRGLTSSLMNKIW